MLTINPLKGIPLVHEGDDIADLIIAAIEKNSIIPADDDVLVIAQKIISKAEGRMANLGDVTPSSKAEEIAGKTEKDARFVELVLRESNEILRQAPGVLIVEHRHGFICANAGIDHSNVQGPFGYAEDWVLLLPEDSDRSAEIIRKKLEERWKIRVGISIIDSHGRAWRNGTTGITIGLSGIPGIVDLRGQPDMFGRTMRITQIGAADELAAASSLVMGQAEEMIPVVHVRGFPYALRESNLDEIIRPKKQDYFR